jgi:hypothetical protein
VGDEPYRAPLPIQADPYAGAWAELRRRWRACERVGLACLVGPIVIVGATLGLPARGLGGVVLGALSLFLFVPTAFVVLFIFAQRVASFHCPHCGNAYGSSRQDGCVHCGIAIGTPGSAVVRSEKGVAVTG